MQIIHPGVLIYNGVEKVYGPSNVLNPLLKTTNNELTKEEILKIEDEYQKAAIRAKKANFDGIDIHCAHLSLLNQFLSPALNKRNDEYGGNDENRVRIIIEIIEKIRRVVGNDFIISVKINVHDGIENGINEKGLLTACKLIEKAGADIIQVSGDFFNQPKNNIPYFIKETEELSNILNIPVVLIGGIRDFDSMEKVLNESNVQYFAIGRPLICEPDLVKRWENGIKDKSKCISCNTCVKKLEHSCVLNKKK